MKWTESQQTAIDARKGSILVSAAAGSGKTAVLVERIMKRIEDGCNIDELLVVTFTNAAASQMREKIASAIEKRIEKFPSNRHILRQRSLLSFAKISTIDALCSSLVRENFQLLDIEPDFKIADELKLREMKNTAAEKAVEEMYAEKDEAFEELTELLFRGRNDSFLVETVIKVDDIACSYPDPEKWINSLHGLYEEKTFSESIWKKLLLRHIRGNIQICLNGVKSAKNVIVNDDKTLEKYLPVLNEDEEIFKNIISVLSSGKSWDDIREAVEEETSKIAKSPVVRSDCPEKGYALEIRSGNRKRIKKLDSFLELSESDCMEDISYSYPLIKAFSRTLLLYRKYLLEIKKESNSYSFSDISEFSMKCLVDKNGEKTALSYELSQKYEEILVDEFQDVNDMQNMLFRLLSKDGKNLFFVGDSKQSIYKFRQARPRIFIELKKNRPVFENDNYPAVVNLDKNFRSRKGVTEWVNFLFERIMIGEKSEIIYDDTEHLKAGAEYPTKNVPDTEIHILEKSKGLGLSSIEEEAHYISQYIKNEIENRLTVTDSGIERPANYGDFCILLRSDGGRIGTFSEILGKYSIPAQTATKGSFFECPEVQIMLSLLKVIDNPLCDIPLLSVMMSPIFGFTPDDLAKIRLSDRKSSLYLCVKKASEDDSRYSEFLKVIRLMRLRAVSLSVGELVRQLLDETGYLAIAGAMPSGDGRRANLLMLQRLADSFESTQAGGLSSFLRFMDGVEEREDRLDKAAVQSGGNNSVKIMTIHKSKGLEFPVCILADCSHLFNYQEYTNYNYIVSADFGMTTVRRDSQRFAQYDTLQKKLSAESGKLSDFNEELRVLYVALTRAKERLVTLSTVNSAETYLKGVSVNISDTGELFSVSEATSYSELLLTAALCHPNAHAFREKCGFSPFVSKGDVAPIKAVISKLSLEEEGVSGSVTEREVDKQMLSKIDERLRFVYPYKELQSVIAKHSASKIDDEGINREYFASSRPAFLNEGGMTPAQRGTSFHKFMQFADFRNSYESTQKEAERLLGCGYLTTSEKDCLDIKKIQDFFNGETGERMLRSEKLYREHKFTVPVSALMLYPELSEKFSEETVIIQGMVDCAFLENGKLHIVDYKTDRVAVEEIANRYASQLKIYGHAMSECLGLEIGDLLLYSFHNGVTIKIE